MSGQLDQGRHGQVHQAQGSLTDACPLHATAADAVQDTYKKNKEERKDRGLCRNIACTGKYKIVDGVCENKAAHGITEMHTHSFRSEFHLKANQAIKRMLDKEWPQWGDYDADRDKLELDDKKEEIYHLLVKLYGKVDGRCTRCGIKLLDHKEAGDGHPFNRVSFDRTQPGSKGGHYEEGNVKRVCTGCNCLKMDHDLRTSLS
ncbi:uncharacterized protein PSFLO_04345 [Pseudozyma flocculosa]|uniref:Uncharacterized protein n=1 Tax=Pseudozyma flocculosa TaxID=84751 RepID=A0A5C3F4I5_9BASI|nr:uncharacterized protein PSFLO_04345 [Pseudozyma flocculosa]